MADLRAFFQNIAATAIGAVDLAGPLDGQIDAWVAEGAITAIAGNLYGINFNNFNGLAHVSIRYAIRIRQDEARNASDNKFPKRSQRGV